MVTRGWVSKYVFALCLGLVKEQEVCFRLGNNGW